jgi:hypothetical protein
MRTLPVLREATLLTLLLLTVLMLDVVTVLILAE